MTKIGTILMHHVNSVKCVSYAKDGVDWMRPNLNTSLFEPGI